MIDYDSFSLCHLADIFLAMHAGAKVLRAGEVFVSTTLGESRPISQNRLCILSIGYVKLLTVY